MSKNNSKNRGRYGWRFRIREILSIWPDKDTVLSFTEIHREFVKRGIVSNFRYKKSTSRILEKLIEEGYLEKIDGGYRLKINPPPFSITNKLEELQLKCGKHRTYEWRVGGTFWTLAEGIILGLPANIDENPYFRAILEVLLIRLANIFEALEAIALAVGIAEEKGEDISSILPPEEAVREYLLNIMPHILGEKSGIDFDGLPTEDIIDLMEQICYDLPDKIRSQPISKSLLQKSIHLARSLYLKSLNLEDFKELKELYFLDDPQAKKIYDKYRNIVLIVYPPRYVFDEKEEDERTLYEYLKDCIEKGMSNALMLAHMRHHEEDVVDRVLKYLKLQSLIPVERAKELQKLYHLARAGMMLDSFIDTYLSLENENKLSSKIINELREHFHKALQKYELEKMIIGVWLSDWPSNKYPKFVPYRIHDKDIVKFVREVILDFLKVLELEPPTNLENLVEEGYKIVNELDEMLKEDANKLEFPNED